MANHSKLNYPYLSTHKLPVNSIQQKERGNLTVLQGRNVFLKGVLLKDAPTRLGVEVYVVGMGQRLISAAMKDVPILLRKEKYV